MDYYGFPPELYKLKFSSKGDKELAQRVVQLYEEV
jgi:aromatic ring-opening dioxygenase catalytic subunit (LigB family)